MAVSVSPYFSVGIPVSLYNIQSAVNLGRSRDWRGGWRV